MCLDIICVPAAAKIHHPLSTCLWFFRHLLGCWLTFQQHEKKREKLTVKEPLGVCHILKNGQFSRSEKLKKIKIMKMMFLLLYYNQTTLGDNKIIFKTHMINIQLLNQQ